MAESVVDLGWLWSIGHALNDFSGYDYKTIVISNVEDFGQPFHPTGISIHIWHGDSKGSFAYFEMVG